MCFCMKLQKVENMDVDFGCKEVYAWDRLFVGFATKGEVGQLPTRDERGRSVATGFCMWKEAY